MRCVARFCPDDVAEDVEARGGVFCSLHWDEIMPAELKAWLAECYGTEHWGYAVKAAIRALWRHESEARSLPW